MKFTQISALAGDDYEGIYALGEDGKVYEYLTVDFNDVKNDGWYPLSSNVYERKVEEPVADTGLLTKIFG